MRCGASSLEGLGSGSTNVWTARYKPDVQMSQRTLLESVSFLAGSPSELKLKKWGSDLYSGGLSFLCQDKQGELTPSTVK
jgi:hypothetical protein